MTELENLIPYGSDKTAYEKRIEEIISAIHRKTSRQYYIAAFPYLYQNTANLNNLKLNITDDRKTVINIMTGKQ